MNLLVAMGSLRWTLRMHYGHINPSFRSSVT